MLLRRAQPSIAVLALGAALAAFGACDPNDAGHHFAATKKPPLVDAGDGGAGGAGGGLVTSTGEGGQSGILTKAPKCEGVDPATDHDGDGWTGADGDCNDCTPLINPGAQDYAGNGIDDDCNGKADDDPSECDDGLAVDAADPVDGARALGLCKKSDGKRWGLVSAAWLTVDGQPLAEVDTQGLGHGVLAAFGAVVKPQEGKRLLALSSGTARLPDQAGYLAPSGYDKGYISQPPAGYPKESPSCPGVTTGEPHDSAALEIVVRTPTNAQSLSFDLDFYTFEWPEFICTTYNDFFVALQTPKPAGRPDGNISFDADGNTISVNASFVKVCACQDGPPCTAGGKDFSCDLGWDPLENTGFDAVPWNSAATGWLVTTSPLPNPGDEVTLRFAVWDSGDGVLDSTVLLDAFRFDPKPAPVETQPIPTPK